MARVAFRRLIESLDARRRRRLRLHRRGTATPPKTGAAPQPSELLQPPTTRAAPQPSELLPPPTTGAAPPNSDNGKARRTQKGQLSLERKIVELAIEHNQGTVLEQLHAPKVDPLIKIVRVSTMMEVKIASWLLKSKAWQFKVVVWGHVTDEELGLLLQEARNEGLTLYPTWDLRN